MKPHTQPTHFNQVLSGTGVVEVASESNKERGWVIQYIGRDVYIRLATCGIPISHHILHILVRLLIPHRDKASYVTVYCLKSNFQFIRTNNSMLWRSKWFEIEPFKCRSSRPTCTFQNILYRYTS